MRIFDVDLVIIPIFFAEGIESSIACVGPMALLPFLTTSAPAEVISINHANMISSSPMVRPKDFPSPFPSSKPEVVIIDQIWFAPDVETPFTFPGFKAIFGREAPFV